MNRTIDRHLKIVPYERGTEKQVTNQDIEDGLYESLDRRLGKLTYADYTRLENLCFGIEVIRGGVGMVCYEFYTKWLPELEEKYQPEAILPYVERIKKSTFKKRW